MGEVPVLPVIIRESSVLLLRRGGGGVGFGQVQSDGREGGGVLLGFVLQEERAGVEGPLAFHGGGIEAADLAAGVGVYDGVAGYQEGFSIVDPIQASPGIAPYFGGFESTIEYWPRSFPSVVRQQKMMASTL